MRGSVAALKGKGAIARFEWDIDMTEKSVKIGPANAMQVDLGSEPLHGYSQMLCSLATSRRRSRLHLTFLFA